MLGPKPRNGRTEVAFVLTADILPGPGSYPPAPGVVVAPGLSHPCGLGS